MANKESSQAQKLTTQEFSFAPSPQEQGRPAVLIEKVLRDKKVVYFQLTEAKGETSPWYSALQKFSQRMGVPPELTANPLASAVLAQRTKIIEAVKLQTQNHNEEDIVGAIRLVEGKRLEDSDLMIPQDNETISKYCKRLYADQKRLVAEVLEDLKKNPEKLSSTPVEKIEAVAAGLPSKTGKRLFERLCNLREEATGKLEGARYKIATSFAIAYLISGCAGQISKPSFEDIRAHLKPSPVYATEMAPEETLWQIQAAKEVFIVVEKQPVETQDPYLEDLAGQNLIEKEMADLKVKHQLTVATTPEEDLAQSKELRAEQVKLTEKIEAKVETMGAATYEYHYIGNPELLEQLRARAPHLARLLESDRLTLVTSEEEGQVIVPQYAEKIFEVDGKHFIEVEMGGKTQMIEVDVPEGTKGLWMNCQTSAISSGLAQTYEEQQLPENFETLGGEIIYQNNQPEKIEHITQLSWGPLTKLVLGEAKQIIWGDRVITSPFHQGEFAPLVQKTQNLSYNYDKIDFVELDQGLQEFLGAMRTLSDKGQGVSLAFRLGGTGGHADTLWGFTVNPDNQRIEGILLTTGWPIEWKSYQEMGAIPFENGVYIPTTITDENGQMVPNRALMQYLIPQGTLVSQKL